MCRWNEILLFFNQINFCRFVFVSSTIRWYWVCQNIADESLSLIRQFERHQHTLIDFQRLINSIIWQDIAIVFDTVYYSISISSRRVFLHLSWLKMTLSFIRIVIDTISIKKHETHYVFETYEIIVAYKLAFSRVLESQTIRRTYDQVFLTI